MELNCELAMGIIIPAVRISVSKRLRRQGMTQSEISKRLGIRQATVSKYLTGRYSRRLRLAERLVDSRGVSSRMLAVALKARGSGQVNDALDGLALNGRLLSAALKLA